MRLPSLSLSPLFLALRAASTIVYEGGTIIAHDDSTQLPVVLRNAHLVVESSKIVALSEGPYNGELPANVTRIDATNKILSPGFIDTHHHMWQTAYRTIYSNISLAEYIQQAGEYSQAGEIFTPEDIYLGEYVAALEAINAGTTTVLDHAHGSFSDDTADAAVDALIDSGIRAAYGFAIHQLSNGYSLEGQIAKFRALTTDARFAGDEAVVQLGLAYDRFAGAPREEIDEIWNIVSEANISVVTTHWTGGSYGYSNSPEVVHNLGWLNTSIPLVFSHASNPSTVDAYLLRNTNQHISITPESEMHFGLTHEYSHLLMDQGTLGVDAHFTFGASMVTQARMWLQRVRALLYFIVLNKWETPINNPMSARQAFVLATQHGGRALRRPDLGVLKVGTQADLVVWNTSGPNLVGWRDPIAALVLHSDVHDVEDVLIGGRFVKRSGRLVQPGHEEIVQRFRASATKIQDIWENSTWPTIGGVNEVGLAYSYTDEADVLQGDGTGY